MKQVHLLFILFVLLPIVAEPHGGGIYGGGEYCETSGLDGGRSGVNQCLQDVEEKLNAELTEFAEQLSIVSTLAHTYRKISAKS